NLALNVVAPQRRNAFHALCLVKETDEHLTAGVILKRLAGVKVPEYGYDFGPGTRSGNRELQHREKVLTARDSAIRSKPQVECPMQPFCVTFQKGAGQADERVMNRD